MSFFPNLKLPCLSEQVGAAMLGLECMKDEKVMYWLAKWRQNMGLWTMVLCICVWILCMEWCMWYACWFKWMSYYIIYAPDLPVDWILQYCAELDFCIYFILQLRKEYIILIINGCIEVGVGIFLCFLEN